MRLFVLMVASLILAGCYESNGLLLDASQSRQPIKTHQDWSYGSASNRHHARLNPRADGWYDYEEAEVGGDGSDGAWKHHTVLLNYMSSSKGLDVYAFATWDDGEKAYFYGLVVVRADGWWQSITPSCDEMAGDEAWTEHDIQHAKAAGAVMKNDTSSVCQFASRDQLLQALTSVANEPGFPQRVNAAHQ